MLYLGTTGTGSSNLYNSGSTAATSMTVATLPANGVTVYARLSSNMSGTWEHDDYTFSEAGSTAPASLITPASGSQLTGSATSFSWTPGVGVTSYLFFLGSTGSGSSNLYNSGTTTATSLTVSGLPVNGTTVYARLFSTINGGYQIEDSTFTAAGTPAPISLIAPAPGSQFAASTMTFSWTPGSATAYQLSLGTSGSGSSNLFNSGSTTATSITASGLPASGVIVYARLSWAVGGVWQHTDYIFTEAGAAEPASMTAPSPGSQLGGSSSTFSWTPGVGATAYKLYLGTTGAGSSNLYNSGSTTANAATVSALPVNGEIIYARLSSNIDGSWPHVDYTFISAVPAALSAVSCGTVSFTGSGSGACTATLNNAAPNAGVKVSLASSSSSVTVPVSIMVAAGASSAPFTATVASVGTAQTVSLTASGGGSSSTVALQLNAAVPTLSVSTGSLAFGNQTVNTAVSQTVTLNSTGNMPVTVTSATLSGAGFTVSGASFPVTLNPAQSATLTVQFDPTLAGAAAGSLAFASNSSTGATTIVNLSGAGTVTLSALSCATSTFTGSGSDACTATLNAAAPTGGVAVTLVSSNSSVTVPASVMVAAGVTNASFTATVASVGTAQTATLTASAGGASSAVALQLNAANQTLTVSAASVAFGNQVVNTAVSQTVTLNSTGNMPVTVSSATVSGAGFTISGTSFPVTLNPAQSATLTVQFDPTSAGAATGSLTFASNSSTGASTVVSLSGTGTVTLSALSCATSTFTGSGSDACTATLSSAAPTGGVVVTLASSNSSVTVPASVTVSAGATIGTFNAAVASVSTSQTATLTATEAGGSMNFAVQLNAATSTLSVSSASVGFGDVNVNTPTTQSLTLTSTGSAAVTVSSAALSGAGFSVSGATFPVTLNAGQMATLEIEFDPATAGAATGTLIIASNSSTGATTAVSLTGTGEATTYQVNLSWVAPSSPSDPIAGYNVYRAASGSSMYQILNSSVESVISYVDTTVQGGLTYDYYVESVDGSGVASAPSSIVAMLIP
jgi:Abnormal spindle-like microcephaly-assoc'd, ASPM-SPD-2-Hydin